VVPALQRNILMKRTRVKPARGEWARYHIGGKRRSCATAADGENPTLPDWPT
jgi:hypothetical protein